MIRPALLPLAVALALTGAARAQNADEAPNQLEQVVVTGTRAVDRTVAESISPIDVISPAALRATGTTELATALSRALPSLNFPRPAVVDGTDAVRPAQLRGLAPDQVRSESASPTPLLPRPYTASGWSRTSHPSQ